MAHINRRTVLRLTGGSAIAAKTGGIAAILASGRAPAFAQAAPEPWLRWADFVPASDVLLKGEITAECQKALGIKLTVETINANDIQARVTSSIQSGAGADIVNLLNNWAHLYVESLAEVDDVAEELGKAQGGFYDSARQAAHDGKRWLAVPYNTVGVQIAYRKSWFDEIGYTKFPQTWDEYRDAGKKLKAKGRPIGQTLGHTFGDAPNFAYPFMWSFGGKEVEADGKTVVLNSKETVESVKYMVGFWKDAHDEGGLAWDDSNNNRAFLAGTIFATNNGASIYIEAKRKPEAYQTEKGTPLKDDIRHAPYPRGSAGVATLHLAQSHMVMKYSKNQKAAKDFLRWASSRAVFEKWFISQKGFSTPAGREWAEHPMRNVDPIMTPFRDVILTARAPGWPGPSGRKAAGGVSKYIITDMYAKGAKGVAPERG